MSSKLTRTAAAVSLLGSSMVGVGLLAASPAQSVVQGLNGYIAFTSDQGGPSTGTDIYVLNPSSPATRTLVVSSPAADRQPAWSPTGDRLAFTSTRNDANGDIFTLTVPGGVLTPLTSGSAADDHATFRPAVPDGPLGPPVAERIGYTSGTNVFEKPSNGTTSTAAAQATSGGGREPSYSPDDSLNPSFEEAGPPELMVTSDATFPGSGGECVYNATTLLPGNGTIQSVDETGALCPVAGTASTESQPAWSPLLGTSKSIAFSTNRDGNFEIYALNLFSGVTSRLTTNSVSDTNPTWSPDGTKIAFTRQMPDGSTDLFTMNAAGGGEVNLTNTPGVNEDHADWGTYSGTLPVVPTQFSLSAAQTVLEPDSGTTPVTFTVTASPVPVGPVTVNWATTATAADVNPPSGSFTYPAGQPSATFTVNVVGDTTFEPNETFNVTISVPAPNAVGTATRTLTIDNDDPVQATFSLAANQSVAEPDSGSTPMTFTVNASPAPTTPVTVNWSSTANAADVSATSGSFTFPSGATTANFAMSVLGDTIVEGTETFNVTISVPAPHVLGTATRLGTITETDAHPTFSVNDITIAEGDTGTTTGTFTVTRTGTATGTYTVQYTVVADTAGAGDFVAVGTPQTLTFAAAGSHNVVVTVNGDTVDEPNEAFRLVLSNPSPGGQLLPDNFGVATITDDDGPPAFTVGNATVTEGNSGTVIATFDVTRTGSATGTYTVNWATAPGTAGAGSDFVAVPSTTLTFAAAGTQQVQVTVNGDTLDEVNETFQVVLSAASGGASIGGAGTGTITDDDAAPDFSVANATVAEGNSGPATAAFVVTRGGTTTGAYSVTYTVTAVAPDTATAGSDFVAVTTPVTLNFAGPGTQTVNVTVNGDTVGESDETFRLTLVTASGGATISDNLGVGTITNDDAAPAFTVSDATVTEGDSGTTNAVFTVTRTGTTTGSYTVNYTVSAPPGTATPGTDFAAVAAGTLTSTGAGNQTVNVAVNGDLVDEADETFTFTLTGASGGASFADTGTGTIVDNDGPPAFSVNDVTVTEGDTGTQQAAFTVSRIGNAAGTYTVNYAVTAGTAEATDFVAVPTTTLTFAAAGPQTVNVTVNNDVVPAEGDETFTITLSNPSGGATISDGTGVGTIVENDLDGSSGTGTASTNDGDIEASANDPLETTVTDPGGGTVTIREFSNGGGTLQLLGQSVDITTTATPPAATNPVVITLVVDTSLVPAGQTLESLVIYRDGVAIGPCTGPAGQAVPNPCVTRASTPGGDFAFTIYTTETSVFAVGPGGSAGGDGLYVVVQSSVTLPGLGSQARNEDVLRYDSETGEYERIFDGSDFGLSDAAIDAFAFDDDGNLILSLTGSFSVRGISGTTDDSDLFKFTPTVAGDYGAGSFSFYFDGSDIGLTASDEDVDALDVIDGDLYLSTTGAWSTSTGGGSDSGPDEDVFVCRDATLGTTSSCSNVERVLNGSDINLGSEDVDGFAQVGGRTYLSTAENYSTSSGSISGKDEDVFECDSPAASCQDDDQLAHFFRGGLQGLSGNDVEAFEVVDSSF